MAAKAEALLENELLISAFTAIREECRQTIELSLPLQPMVREEAYFILRAMGQLLELLTGYADSGMLLDETEKQDKAEPDEPKDFDSPNERRAWYHP